jgi:hypothetical protein
MESSSNNIIDLPDEVILLGQKMRKALLKEYPFWPKDDRDRYVDGIYEAYEIFDNLSDEAYEINNLLDE